jgi:hypothetical protein
MKKSSKNLPLLWGAIALATPVLVWASNLTVPNTFSMGTPISSSQMNTNFQAVQTAVNSKQDAITQTCGGGSAITAIGTNGTTGTATCSAVQSPISETCAPGQAISALNPSGTATCAAFQSPISQTCAAGEAITAIGTTGTATCAAFQDPIPQTCAAGQWINAVTASGATCAGPTQQVFIDTLQVTPTVAGTNTVMSTKAITTGAVAMACQVSAMCNIQSSVASGGVSVGMVEQDNGGAINSLAGISAEAPVATGVWTSATMVTQTTCAANTNCLLGASINNVAAGGAIKCNITWLCVGT